MKINKFLLITAFLLAIIMGSCSKDVNTSGSPMTTSTTKMANTSGAALINNNTIALTGKDAVASTGIQGVNLGVAGDFVILSKTGITDVYKSTVTGDIGSSPI